MAPRTTEDQWNETHENIMREAQRLFATKGFNGASMNDIVNASGVSKGAIYNHFQSKEQLFMTLLDLETERGFGQLETLMSAGHSILDKLIAAIKYTFSTSVACPKEMCMMQIEFMMTASRIKTINPSLLKRYQTIHSFFVNLINEAKQSGEIREDVDSENLVTLVYAMLDGLAFQHATIGIQYDPEYLEKVLLELIIGNIKAK